MKNRIQIILYKTLKKIMHAFGFFIQKLPSADVLYERLQTQDLKVKEYELKRITSFYRIANNKKHYNQILLKYIPQLSVNLNNTEFVGNGMGASSLDAFRKIKTNLDAFRKIKTSGTYLFEKIYFNSSIEIKRVQFFHENVVKLIGKDIHTPKIVEIKKGEIISAFHFQFIDLKSSSKSLQTQSIFQASITLYNVSKQEHIQHFIDIAPDFLKDYSEHFEYKRQISKAARKAQILLKNNFSFIEVEKTIKNSAYILTHGDLHKGNMLNNDLLIDWDSFGIYPIGFETAFVLFRLKLGKFSYEELVKIIDDEYKNTISPKEWDNFQLNCFYFYFVFTIHFINGKEGSITQKKILNKVNVLYSQFKTEKAIDAK